MSFLDKAKTGGREPLSFIHEQPDELARSHERRGEHFQAVRVRLWNARPQRHHHRNMVERWQNSRLAQSYPPPPVPEWVDEMPRDNSEQAQMDRALWLLERRRVAQEHVNAWPPRWRDIGITRGYLNTDGTLRFSKEGA